VKNLSSEITNTLQHYYCCSFNIHSCSNAWLHNKYHWHLWDLST